MPSGGGETGEQSVAERARSVTEEFSALGDWLDRYRYLAGLGAAMDGLGAVERTDETRLPGCEYGMWIATDYDAAAGVLHFRVDSDAKLTRGLAALVLRVLDGQPPAAVVEADLGFLDAMGLRQHLSPQRSHGLAAMIDEMRARARHFLDADGPTPSHATS